MATIATRRYNPDSYYQTEIVYDDFDDIQQGPSRRSPIKTISYNPQHQFSERQDDSVSKNSNKCSKCCSKQCLIGLSIGLLIGIILVIVIAVPIGVLIRKCQIGTISSTPNWVGTFRMDGSCVTTYCCCYSDEVTLSQTSSNLLQIAGKVIGACSTSSSTVSVTQIMPTTFQTSFNTYSVMNVNHNVRLQLGRDNSYISFVNLNEGQCSANGLRTSCSVGSTIGINVFLILLIFTLSLIVE